MRGLRGVEVRGGGTPRTLKAVTLKPQRVNTLLSGIFILIRVHEFWPLHPGEIGGTTG